MEGLEKALNKGVKLIEGIKAKPKKSVVRQIQDINQQLVDGDWQVKTVVEMMGQAAVAATEQKVLLDDLDKDIKNVYGGYKSVYKSALHGVKQGKDLLGRLAQLCEDMVLQQKMDYQLLSKYGFNRWLEDGSKAEAVPHKS
jgi:hypothetical protein